MTTVAEASLETAGQIPEGADPELFRQVYEAFPAIIDESNRILLGNTALANSIPPPSEGPDPLVNIGREALCIYASDAVTRAAQTIGLPAAREQLTGLHFITFFGDPKQPPSPTDIVACRTWGQFDTDAFNNPEHPNGGRPFLGTRAQLAALLPHMGSTFTSEGVIRRSVTHRQKPNKSPDREHQWLGTTPADLATYTFSATGELTVDDTTYRESAWAPL